MSKQCVCDVCNKVIGDGSMYTKNGLPKRYFVKERKVIKYSWRLEIIPSGNHCVDEYKPLFVGKYQTIAWVKRPKYKEVLEEKDICADCYDKFMDWRDSKWRLTEGSKMTRSNEKMPQDIWNRT